MAKHTRSSILNARARTNSKARRAQSFLKRGKNASEALEGTSRQKPQQPGKFTRERSFTLRRKKGRTIFKQNQARVAAAVGGNSTTRITARMPVDQMGIPSPIEVPKKKQQQISKAKIRTNTKAALAKSARAQRGIPLKPVASRGFNLRAGLSAPAGGVRRRRRQGGL